MDPYVKNFLSFFSYLRYLKYNKTFNAWLQKLGKRLMTCAHKTLVSLTPLFGTGTWGLQRNITEGHLINHMKSATSSHATQLRRMLLSMCQLKCDSFEGVERSSITSHDCLEFQPVFNHFASLIVCSTGTTAFMCVVLESWNFDLFPKKPYPVTFTIL